MEALAGLDAAFLALDTDTAHFHVGAALILDPPEGTRSLFSPSTRFVQLQRHIESRVRHAPALRRRMVRVPFGLHHPVWVEDPEFDLDDHVVRLSLPAPGSERELWSLIADVMSRPLDPHRPLWEVAIVEGLVHGRSALVFKFHHAMLDGVSAASLLALFLDLRPRVPAVLAVANPAHGDPPSLPSHVDMLRYAARQAVHQPGVLAHTLSRSVDALVGVARQNERLAQEGGAPPPAPFSAPRSPFNATISSRRSYASVRMRLSSAKLVGRIFGATVNDVILAVVSSGLRQFMLNHGNLPDRALVALVPVSTRQPDEADALGNRISGMLVALATDEVDPVARLLSVVERSRIAKAQHELTGGGLLAGAANVFPPAVTSRAARLIGGLGVFDRLPPPFNVTVSSVRGPDVALWCAGGRVVAVDPVGPITNGLGLNVTAISYLDDVHIGLLSCRRLVPDLNDLAELFGDAAEELSAAALQARGAAG